MEEKRRWCRRCLTEELPDAVYYQNMYDYIKNLEADLKTLEELYRQR